MKRITPILAAALLVLIVVCLFAGLSISATISFCIAGGFFGVLAALASTKVTGSNRFQTCQHPFRSLMILHVLTASLAFTGMVAETQLLGHFGSSPGGLTLLLWPLVVFIALFAMTTSALESLQTVGRRVAAYTLAIVISTMQTYWHVFYLINKYET